MSAEVAYSVGDSFFVHGSAEEALSSPTMEPHKGEVDLIFTSPPFPLNRKKSYGNLQGQEYLEWLKGFATTFGEFLSPRGSIVIEIGNSWNKGEPTMSTLGLRSLLSFLEEGDLHLCQQFVWSNPAKLPSPAQWVNIERIRVKDSFTHIWWMSPVKKPKADNRRVLTEYSDSMKKLLEEEEYNPGERPSEWDIGEDSFLNDNGGAIPPSVITESNTKSNSDYLSYCRDKDITIHPARMPISVAKFFVKLLTEPGDLVLDPFAGSGTTCKAAQSLNRDWIGIEPDEEYVKGSQGRFIQHEIAMNWNG